MSVSPGAGTAGRVPAAVGALLVLTLLLGACAAGPNPSVGVATEGGEVAGFWFGLWHGLIAPVTFVLSLFNESVGIYEVHNSGAGYDLGFVLGLGFLVGGGSQAGR